MGYSRESTEPKRYIDVVMRENADGIRDLIARGGHVYVCGDIRIEESVRKALVDILGNGDAVKVKDLLPISPDTGTAALAQLEKEHKIHLDIFGAFDVHGTQDRHPAGDHQEGGQHKAGRRHLGPRRPQEDAERFVRVSCATLLRWRALRRPE